MMRTPLASISGNRNRYHEYTPFQRGAIAGAVGHGATPHRINKLYKIPISSIKSIVSNALIRHNSDSKLRSGKPRKLTVRDGRHILKIVRRLTVGSVFGPKWNRTELPRNRMEPNRLKKLACYYNKFSLVEKLLF